MKPLFRRRSIACSLIGHKIGHKGDPNYALLFNTLIRLFVLTTTDQKHTLCPSKEYLTLAWLGQANNTRRQLQLQRQLQIASGIAQQSPLACQFLHSISITLSMALMS